VTSQTATGGNDEKRVLMYSTGFCGYCSLAERLLKSKGATAIERVRVDLDPARRSEMMLLTGKRTVPQIYIGDTYVGGWDELRALDRAGKLESLLAAAGVNG
jgi:glutaredoxin 3